MGTVALYRCALFRNGFWTYGFVADSRTACAFGVRISEYPEKAPAKSRHCVAVPSAHGVLKALDIRVALKRCAVERRGCHLSRPGGYAAQGGNRIATWNGIQTDAVEVVRREPFQAGFRAPCHLLIMCERAERDGGETLVEGLPRS